FQAEDGIRDATVTGVQTCALPISPFADWAFHPTVYVDITATLDDKLRAFEAYRNTFISEVKPYPHPRSPEALRVYAQQRGIAVEIGRASCRERGSGGGSAARWKKE